MSTFLEKKPHDTLYEAVLQLRNVEECRSFFQDLCTVSEIKAMEQRMEAAVMLESGSIYSDVLQQTGASSATISRVNKSLHYGEGGYKTVIARLQEQKHE